MTKTGNSSRRRVWFVLGLLVAIAALVFTLAPSHWFHPSGESDGDGLDMTDLEIGDDPAHTIAVLEEMLQAHPGHSPIALELANLYFDQGEFQKAIQYYRSFLQSDTSATGFEVALDLARALFHTGKGDEAVAEIEKLLKQHPDHAGGLYNLGAIEANRGNFDAARVAWERLISMHPDDSLAVFAKQSLPKLQLPPGHP